MLLSDSCNRVGWATGGSILDLFLQRCHFMQRNRSPRWSCGWRSFRLLVGALLLHLPEAKVHCIHYGQDADRPRARHCPGYLGQQLLDIIYIWILGTRSSIYWCK